MKILITGGTGLLGKTLIERAKDNYNIMATHLGHCGLKNTARVTYRIADVRDERQNRSLYEEFRPDVTIHTAGIGSPDYAAAHKEETEEINVGGTRNILKNCENFRSTFIYISSNGIYDGDNAPYREDDEANPVNYYGQIKLECEKISRKSAIPCSIVRPMLLYGWNHPGGRQNIVTYALSKLENGEKIFAYNDVFVNPVFAPTCADVIWKIIEEKRYETFNIAGRDTVSIYELVRKAAKAFNLNTGLVMPIQQGFFKELIGRPKDTSYDTGKMRGILRVTPISIEEGLVLMKKSRKY